ncbi:hypothetical protein SCUCBS95973_001002 [Sporothrix curviconia]|uniref:CBM-cenC domain-containing protein n=1 Tax=Sporothrix curviconia TaxID=1260050 RepID=A0ABP0AUW2_9PEZI
MKFSNLLLLAVACAESAVASRCKPKPTPSSTSSVSTHSSASTSPSHSSSPSPSPSPSYSPSQSSAPSSGQSSEPSTSHSMTQPPSSSSTFHTSTRTASSTSSIYSEPASDCPDLPNGNFASGQLGSWYNSNQMTTEYYIRNESPTAGGYAFAMTPDQTQFAQIYINQNLPSCGPVPYAAVLRVQFAYMFTGASTGCQISVAVNQGGPVIATVLQTGHTANTWYTYSGPATDVTLGYTPLFTVEMSCESNTAMADALLVTNIKAYA